METVKDVLEHCKFLIGKGRGDEPGKLYMPRIEAQRRKANKEQHKRIVFVTNDPQLYSDWHAQKDRYVTLCYSNPNLAFPVMLQILAAVADETIVGLANAEQHEESLNDA